MCKSLSEIIDGCLFVRETAVNLEDLLKKNPESSLKDFFRDIIGRGINGKYIKVTDVYSLSVYLYGYKKKETDIVKGEYKIFFKCNELNKVPFPFENDGKQETYYLTYYYMPTANKCHFELHVENEKGECIPRDLDDNFTEDEKDYYRNMARFVLKYFLCNKKYYTFDFDANVNKIWNVNDNYLLKPFCFKPKEFKPESTESIPGSSAD